MSNPTNIAASVRARFNHHQSRIYLTEKYQNQLTIVSQNGTWTITPEFLSVLKTLPDTMILLDDNNRPTRVNTKELYTECLDIYETLMAEWLDEFVALEKNR